MSDLQNKDLQLEQERVNFVIKEIEKKRVRLQKNTGGVSSDVLELRKTFWEDVTVNMDEPDDVIETAASIKQQAELLSERERTYKQMDKQIRILDRLKYSPYFGRIDFFEKGEANVDHVYLGIASFMDEHDENFLIYDWRAPISSLYYDFAPGPASYNTLDGEIAGKMELKRQFIIRASEIKAMFETGVTIGDEMLQEVLGNNANAQMKSIVATIQREQNQIIRNEHSKLLIVQGVAGVKAVYPDVTYKVTSVGKGEILSKDEYSPNMLASAPYIGANKAWDAGFTGKGVTVAVIDTGADYTHPDLKHAFGDYKGYDFVDNDNDPQETPRTSNPDDETAHGTHVSGTVAANGKIKGVAPDAKLLAYRVLGPGGSGTTENVIAGIERAVQDGADVMNLSLGNSLNDPDYATSIALDWAMAEGVVAVTSNGNSGPANWTVGSPGTSRDAISVGATQLPYNEYNSTISTSAGVSYPSAKVMGFPSDKALTDLNGKEYEFVDVGFGSPAEFVGKDLNGNVALISRGAGIAFVDKAIAAKEAGAVAAIIYNNVAGEIVMVPGTVIPTIRTTAADGATLLSELKNGNNKVTFNISKAGQVGETMADFSSRGPVNSTWMIKPDVSAPGVNITSTVPTHDSNNPHGYASYQGTSMASPHVAGTAALILQANPGWSVQDVKAALMNTAEELKDANGKVYPHNTQGAGSIRVLDAVTTKTLAAPGSHSFGTFYKEKGKQVEKQQFTIKNLSSENKTYSFKVNMGENSNAIKVSTSNNLKVNAGKSQSVNLNVQVDAGRLDQGYYEGTITISDGSATFDVPTILFVKEPDYPRAEYVGVNQLGDGQFEIQGLFPGGAEEVELFVYLSNADGAPLGYLGDIAVYENVAPGYTTFTWDGRISVGANGIPNGFKLPAGNYYNVYAYATYKGQSDLAGANFLIR